MAEYVKVDYLQIHEDELLLDLGCGDGDASIMAENMGCSVFAVDILPRCLKRVKEKSIDKRIFPILCDAGRLPFKACTFNKAFLLEVLEHVREDLLVIQEINRVLKIGGLLCLSIPNYFTENLYKHIDPSLVELKGPGAHVRTYKKQEIERLLRMGGFKIFATSDIGFLEAAFWVFYFLLRPGHLDISSGYGKPTKFPTWSPSGIMFPLLKRNPIIHLFTLLGCRIFPRSSLYYCRKALPCKKKSNASGAHNMLFSLQRVGEEAS